MKCPKCGYTSFDYLDDCKRCNTDLRDTRTLLQIIAVSPEDRAPKAPSAAARGPAAEGQAALDVESSGEAPIAQGEFLGEPEDEEVLENLDFEDSFEGMVEHTSYQDGAGAAAPEATESQVEEEDDLLDLDFGELFGEKSSPQE